MVSPTSVLPPRAISSPPASLRSTSLAYAAVFRTSKALSIAPPSASRRSRGPASCIASGGDFAARFVELGLHLVAQLQTLRAVRSLVKLAPDPPRREIARSFSTVLRMEPGTVAGRLMAGRWGAAVSFSCPQCSCLRSSGGLARGTTELEPQITRTEQGEGECIWLPPFRVFGLFAFPHWRRRAGAGLPDPNCGRKN